MGQLALRQTTVSCFFLLKKDNTELQFILNEWLVEDNQEIRTRIVSAYAKHSEKTINGKLIKIVFIDK